MRHSVIFNGDKLWIRRQGAQAVCLLDAGVPAGAAMWTESLETPGSVVVEAVETAAALLPDGVETVTLRDFFDLAAPADYALASLAFEMLHWRRSHRFCGRCGRPLVRHATERAMECAACRDLVYPRTNPVVITRVTRGREILLARRVHGASAFYSVIAGFVEAAETLEHAVEREIAEEVGIRVRNLRYFGSQPWPYPNNLMCAFTAEHDGGEIHVDGKEIGTADWFTPGNLPAIPPPVSISRRLIDAWLAEQRDSV
jgi:NAD+ diphosphatase